MSTEERDVVFSPTAKANGVFSPDKLRCAPVQLPGQVPESSESPSKVPDGEPVLAGGSGAR